MKPRNHSILLLLFLTGLIVAGCQNAESTDPPAPNIKHDDPELTHFGMIRAVQSSDLGMVALVDFMLLFHDSQADQAAMEEGVTRMGDFHIVDPHNRIDTLPFSNDVKIRLLYHAGTDTLVSSETLAHVLQHDSTVGKSAWYGIDERGVSGHMVIENGVIVSFEQQYFP